MSELTKQQYEELPEFLQSNYIEDGEGYSHKGMMKVKQTANDLDSKFKTIESELSEYREKEQERIDLAEQKAYEKAKKEGNTEELEIRLNQKIADAERRADESATQFKERMQKLSDKQKRVITAELSAKYAKTGADLAFKRLLSDFIQVDPETDEETYLDDEGRATSLKRAEFERWINNHALFEHLIKADVTTNGGGNVNGSNGTGRASTKNPKDMNSAERKQLKADDPEEFKRLFLT